MKWIRQKVLSGKLMAGAWCNLGSSLTVEIAWLAGFDWILIDIEHGSGDYDSLVHQLRRLCGLHGMKRRGSRGC